jgi:homoserine dehydrogenase
MSVEIAREPSTPTTNWPLRIQAAKPSPRAVRTIRVGLLGLGRVGQAVARLAADRGATAHAGIRFHVEQALVRDLEKARHCPRPGRVTASTAAFLRGHHDVVVDAFVGVEPARTLAARLLGQGTSVVTCNKALVAEHGVHLDAIASAHGAAFRFEATALSAVPFLGTLAARPLVASVDRLIAVVNGTSNDVVSALGDGVPFGTALARAREAGFAEPDASRDIDGLDAADTLLLLTSLFGWGRLTRESLDVRGIRDLGPDDLAAARSLGGTIKPIVFAQRDSAGVRAFVGPAFIPATDPLASLRGPLTGIRLDGRHVSNLFFSGPGAGPDVIAATLLDDVAQAASADRRRSDKPARILPPVCAASPATSWFVRVTFPGIVPAPVALVPLVGSAGLHVDGVCHHAGEHSRWLIVGPHSRRDLDAALARLASTHRIQSTAFRRI